MSKDSEEKYRILQLLSANPHWGDTLAEALDREVDGKEKFSQEQWGEYYGWEWHQVHTPVPTLNKMVSERLLDVTLSTRSGTHFKIRKPELVKESLEMLMEHGAPPVETQVPTDLFDIIVGHDNIKTLVRYAIEAEKPVHFLFTGPPASAKTLFLMELSRLPDSYYCIAQTTSQAGLANLLFTFQPKYLLIDEIDRLGGEHVGVLNSLMATGIVSESKFGKTRETTLPTKVFAAGIRMNAVPRDLLSRFTRIPFSPYNEVEFVKVSVEILRQREGVTPEVGEIIAKRVWSTNEDSSDVRQCVQIARLAGGDSEKAIEILKILKR